MPIAVGTAGSVKPIEWVGSSQDDLRAFPKNARRVMGQALFEAQRGVKHPDAKPMQGFGGAGVLEVVGNYDGDTYRTVYTIHFAGVVYVLHAFQKKSKRGVATTKRDIELIRARLRLARGHHAEAMGRRR